MNWRASDFRVKVYTAITFSVWFWLIYWTCDFLTHSFPTKYHVEIWLDGYIPFLPFFAYFYMLINPLLLLPIFLIKDTTEYLALYLVLAISVLIAGIIFLVFPVVPLETPYDPNIKMFQFSTWVNLTYNSLPSLHVALSMIVGLVCSKFLSGPGKFVLWTVVTLVVTSTLLIHAHYIVDVGGGILLSCVCVWLFLEPIKLALLKRNFG